MPTLDLADLEDNTTNTAPMPMQFVTETRNRDVSFLLHPLNYTQLYHRLKTLLNPEEIRVFGKPDSFGDTTSWSADTGEDGRVRDTAQLSSEQNDELADRLENLKMSILSKAANIPELAKKAHQLFTIPASTALKAVVSGNDVYPLLIQWGCQSNRVQSTIDPLSTFLSRPRSNSAQVSIALEYTTGGPIADRNFYLEYNGRESREKANGEGLYHRGRCKIGSQLEVYDRVDNEVRYAHRFTVTPDGTYTVRFPRLIAIRVQMLDQERRPLASEPVQLGTPGTLADYTTDADGFVSLPYWEAGTELEMRDGQNPDAAETVLPQSDGEIIPFVVRRGYTEDATVDVVDENGAPCAHYTLELQAASGKRMVQADSKGGLRLQGLPAGETIRLSNPANESNHSEYTVQRPGPNHFVFTVRTEPVKLVTVRLLDRKKKPLPNVEIRFTYKGGTNTAVTDASGAVQLPQGSFVDGETVNAKFELPKKERKEGKNKEKTKNQPSATPPNHKP